MENSRLAKVIVVGDKDQLIPVEPGNLFGDLYRSLKSMAPACCVDLSENHFANPESKIIHENAKSIVEGRLNQVKFDHDFFQLCKVAPLDFFT